jgi:hypothetical protein
MMLRDDNKRFVEEFANPHSWFLTADDLHEQAVSLNSGRSRSGITTRRDKDGRIVRQIVGVDKSVFLLGGFALENVIKAFLVYENPEWISGGKLAGKLRSHSLVKLHGLSNLVPFKKKHLWVLREFESGLESWFRYPCALSIVDTIEGSDMSSELWEGYTTVMAAYGKKLMTLLGKGWKGPCGYYGKWSFHGEYLGHKRHLPAIYHRA